MVRPGHRAVVAPGREHPCTAASQPPRTAAGLARGQWEAVGTGASSPSLGKLQGRRLPEGPSQGGSPGTRLPLTPLLVTPGRMLGPLEGLPSLTHEIRSISLSRWSAGETALLGGSGAKCRTRGERHSPFLAARHRARGQSSLLAHRDSRTYL